MCIVIKAWLILTNVNKRCENPNKIQLHPCKSPKTDNDTLVVSSNKYSKTF